MDRSCADILDDLMVWAEGQGVALCVFERTENAWEIDTLVRDPDSPKGTGRSVIIRLIQEADDHGCALRVTVPHDNETLKDLAVQFGFVPDGELTGVVGDLHLARPPASPTLMLRRRARPG